jgi:hypothetical protein
MSEDILKATFNPVNESTATIQDSTSDIVYLVRYTVTSETGEILAPWSQINEINQQSASLLLNGFVPEYSVSSVESGGEGINIKWTVPDSFSVSKFDIYFAWSWDSNISTATFTDFEYADTVSANSYYMKIPLQSSIKAKFVKFAVQIPTRTKIINTNALILQSSAKSTLPILDSGTIV